MNGILTQIKKVKILRTVLIGLLGFNVLLSQESSYDEQIANLESQKISLQADIDKINREISRTDSLTKDEKSRFEILESRFETDLSRRQKELDDLQEKLNLAVKSLQKEKNIQYSYDLKNSSVEVARKNLRQDLIEQCKELESLISLTIPWDNEKRINRVLALRRDLENSNATAEEGFSRLKAIYSEEIRLGDEITLSSKSITRNDGEVINAKILKIGNQWMVYTNEEESHFGVLKREMLEDGSFKYSWNEALSFSERQAVKLAIDVKSARKPPQIVKLPVSLSLSPKSGDEKNIESTTSMPQDKEVEK